MQMSDVDRVVTAATQIVQRSAQMNPDLSIVIPIYNEEEGLPLLFERLYPALDALERSYEVVFVDDGSSDRSVAHAARAVPAPPGGDPGRGARPQRRPAPGDPGRIPQTRGTYVITLDADLQNPPEEIARLVQAMDEGADYVGTIRLLRHDVHVAQGGLAPDEPHPRGHHLDPHHRPGLHAARLPPHRDRCGQPLHRGEHLRSRAGLYLCAPPGRDRGQPRRPRRRAVQVFPLPADPPELRPDDRVLGGAAAVLLHGRWTHRAGVADPGGRGCWCAA